MIISLTVHVITVVIDLGKISKTVLHEKNPYRVLNSWDRHNKSIYCIRVYQLHIHQLFLVPIFQLFTCIFSENFYPLIINAKVFLNSGSIYIDEHENQDS